jgi:peptide/nickel transport system ATP-binding protein
MTIAHRPLLEVRLSVDYPAKPGVLDRVELEIRAGEITGIVGSSGSGKSTLALALLRLLEFRGGRASGEIYFQGKDLMRTRESEMRSVRGREMAFVPQSPASFLNPAMRVDAQMAEAWKAHRKGSRVELERDVCAAVEQVGLPAERAFLHRYPGELSVGQAQRILIAMAILHKPALLIADEPTSALDVISQSEVLRLLGRLNRELGMAILYISHDLLSISNLCHRVAILHEGRIVECATASSIFEAPQHVYTQQLIGAVQCSIPSRDHRERLAGMEIG